MLPHRRIADRPAIVAQRSRVGDWEGDLVVGLSSRSAVATLVDRKSRYLKLVHLPDGHTAEQLVKALTHAMSATPVDKRLTLTWDQGSEMARHDLVAELFAEGVFFANPGSPWMRGTNENTNGLVRQYLPKAPTCASTPPRRCSRSRPSSTPDPARHSTGGPPRPSST